MENTALTISINSFSYKSGLKNSDTEHGMGFVFDMRGIHNPGRYPEYKFKSGRDIEVINYLMTHSEIEDYLLHVFALLEITIRSFIERKFTRLQVNFGCTGGQHRSVYAADKTYDYIRLNFPEVNLLLEHQNQSNWLQSEQ
jgi:RNase adaptor protein for sRNA GlmZ degradation